MLWVREDQRFVRGLVARLTRQHEARSQQPRPCKMSDASTDHNNGLILNIVGIEIEIIRLMGTLKPGQNTKFAAGWAQQAVWSLATRAGLALTMRMADRP